MSYAAFMSAQCNCFACDIRRKWLEPRRRVVRVRSWRVPNEDGAVRDVLGAGRATVLDTLEFPPFLDRRKLRDVRSMAAILADQPKTH